MKFRLVHIGIVLIGVPLVFELALLGYMQRLVHSRQSSLKQIIHSRAVLSTTSRLAADYLETMNLLDQTVRVGVDYKRLLDRLNRIRSRVDEFDEIAETPSEKENARLARSGADKVLQLVSPGLELYRSTRLAELIALFKQNKAKVVSLNTSMRTLTTLSNETMAISRAELATQEHLERKAGAVAVAALVASLVISFGLAILFTRGISAKVNVMIDNCLKLAKGEPLAPESPGSDELSQLDRDFHEMAGRVLVARMKAQESRRMRSQMLAMLTKDLCAPLSEILSALEKIKCLDLTEREQRLLQIAGQDAKLMVRLATDLVDVDKLQAREIRLQYSEFRLAEVIAEVTTAAANFAGPKKLTFIAKGDALVIADRDRLNQVVMNLVVNALKYSPDRGTMTLEISSDNDWVIVSVLDQGKGIPAEKLNKIFEPFEQVEARGQLGGVGLGLAVCEGLNRLHGGKIWVESDGKTGSKFSFKIPRAPLNWEKGIS